jgi:hypothetical protein
MGRAGIVRLREQSGARREVADGYDGTFHNPVRRRTDLKPAKPPTRPRDSKRDGKLAVPDHDSRRIVRTIFAVVLLTLTAWMLRSYLFVLAWAIVTAIAIWPLYQPFARREFEQGNWIAIHRHLRDSSVAGDSVLLAVTEIGREGQAIVKWIGDAQQNGVPVPE